MIWQNNNRKTASAKKLAEIRKENEALKEQMQAVMAAVEKLDKAKK